MTSWGKVIKARICKAFFRIAMLMKSYALIKIKYVSEGL